MPECHFCGKETAKLRYCDRECARKAQFKGEHRVGGQGFLLNTSIYQDGKEKGKRLRLFNKAKEGCETAILELRLRYGLRVIQ